MKSQFSSHNTKPDSSVEEIGIQRGFTTDGTYQGTTENQGIHPCRHNLSACFSFLGRMVVHRSARVPWKCLLPERFDARKHGGTLNRRCNSNPSGYQEIKDDLQQFRGSQQF